MKFTSLSQQPKQVDILLIPVLHDDNIKENISKIALVFGLDTDIIQQDIHGNNGEVVKLYPNKIAKRVYILGCGDRIGFKNVKQAFKALSFKEQKNWTRDICLDCTYLDATPLLIEAAINALMLGTYQVGLYKTDDSETTSSLLHADFKVVSKLSDAAVLKAAEKAKATAKTQLQIMDLVNAPGNKATPQALAAWAVQSGKIYNYKVKVLHKKEIEETGLNTVLAVNRGSEYPPEFIIMEYKPETDKKLKKVGLVGKGVTFDTGGLSIKGSNNMHYMKSDMGGAAAVMGTIELAAKLKLNVHLIGIVPATDNCVDATAVKPGDVIHSYSGKTIEIIDTDAEGRLILADGIAYMNKHYSPDILIDIATLTGSTVRTLGYQAGGLFSNNDDLITQLEAAGHRTGERLWSLPIWDEYFDGMRSDVADIKNFSSRPIAGAIEAAKFLEFFTNNHPQWAHLDIAGVAFGNSGLAKQKSSTAYGINLMIDYLMGF